MVSFWLVISRDAKVNSKNVLFFLANRLLLLRIKKCPSTVIFVDLYFVEKKLVSKI